MFQKVEICSCKKNVENGKEYHYKYYLIESFKKFNINQYEVIINTYGIEISRELVYLGKTIEILTDAIQAVSTVKSKVIELIEYLSIYEVSPLHLVDIAGKFVDEWVGDFDVEGQNILDQASLPA